MVLAEFIIYLFEINQSKCVTDQVLVKKSLCRCRTGKYSWLKLQHMLVGPLWLPCPNIPSTIVQAACMLCICIAWKKGCIFSSGSMYELICLYLYSPTCTVIMVIIHCDCRINMYLLVLCSIMVSVVLLECKVGCLENPYVQTNTTESRMLDNTLWNHCVAAIFQFHKLLIGSLRFLTASTLFRRIHDDTVITLTPKNSKMVIFQLKFKFWQTRKLMWLIFMNILEMEHVYPVWIVLYMQERRACVAGLNLKNTFTLPWLHYSRLYLLDFTCIKTYTL
jgi:hypothetical protein